MALHEVIEDLYDDPFHGTVKMRCTPEMLQDIKMQSAKIMVMSSEIKEDEINAWMSINDIPFSAPIMTPPITDEEVEEWKAAYEWAKNIGPAEIKKIVEKYKIVFEHDEFYEEPYKEVYEYFGMDKPDWWDEKTTNWKSPFDFNSKEPFKGKWQWGYKMDQQAVDDGCFDT